MKGHTTSGVVSLWAFLLFKEMWFYVCYNACMIKGILFDYDGTLRQVYGHSSKADTYVTVSSGYKFYVGETEYTKSTVLKYGMYDVVVKWNGETTESYPILVDYADPTGISLPSEYELGPSDSVCLADTAVVLPEGDAENAITWSIAVTDGDLTSANYTFNEANGTVTIASDNKVPILVIGGISLTAVLAVIIKKLISTFIMK